MNLYDFTVLDIDKKPVSLSDYKDQGLVILGFPCNQFAHQAPENDAEIASFCSLHYDVKFPQFAKIEVNGDKADPLYNWLKSEQKGTFGNAIKWNFKKYL